MINHFPQCLKRDRIKTSPIQPPTNQKRFFRIKITKYKKCSLGILLVRNFQFPLQNSAPFLTCAQNHADKPYSFTTLTPLSDFSLPRLNNSPFSIPPYSFQPSDELFIVILLQRFSQMKQIYKLENTLWLFDVRGDTVFIRRGGGRFITLLVLYPLNIHKGLTLHQCNF